LPPKTCMRANAAAPNPVEIMMVLQCALQGLAGRYKQGVGPDRHLCLPHIPRDSCDDININWTIGLLMAQRLVPSI